jgi:hypothetical protein
VGVIAHRDDPHPDSVAVDPPHKGEGKEESKTPGDEPGVFLRRPLAVMAGLVPAIHVLTAVT